MVLGLEEASLFEAALQGGRHRSPAHHPPITPELSLASVDPSEHLRKRRGAIKASGDASGDEPGHKVRHLRTLRVEHHVLERDELQVVLAAEVRCLAPREVEDVEGVVVSARLDLRQRLGDDCVELGCCVLRFDVELEGARLEPGAELAGAVARGLCAFGGRPQSLVGLLWPS